MKNDYRISLIVCIMVILIGTYAVCTYKMFKDCNSKGGVLVQGAIGYVCVPAAGEKK